MEAHNTDPIEHSAHSLLEFHIDNFDVKKVSTMGNKN